MEADEYTAPPSRLGGAEIPLYGQDYLLHFPNADWSKFLHLTTFSFCQATFTK